MRVELPSGNWVELRDADSIRRRDRDAIIRTADEADPIKSLNAAIRQLVINSSFDDLSDEALDDWTLPDTNVVEKHVADLMSAFAPDFGPNPDPKAPTAK